MSKVQFDADMGDSPPKPRRQRTGTMILGKKQVEVFQKQIEAEKAMREANEAVKQKERLQSLVAKTEESLTAAQKEKELEAKKREEVQRNSEFLLEKQREAMKEATRLKMESTVLKAQMLTIKKDRDDAARETVTSETKTRSRRKSTIKRADTSDNSTEDEAQYNKMRDEYFIMKTQLSHLATERARLQDELNFSVGKLRLMESEVSDSHEKSRLESELRDTRIQQLELTLDLRGEELTHLRKQLKQKEDENRVSMDEIQQGRIAMEVARRELANKDKSEKEWDAEKKEMEKTKRDYESKMSSLNNTVSQLKAQVTLLQNEVERGKQMGANEVKTVKADFTLQLEQQKELVRQGKEAYDELKTKLDTQEKYSEELRTHIKELNNQIEISNNAVATKEMQMKQFQNESKSVLGELQLDRQRVYELIQQKEEEWRAKVVTLESQAKMNEQSILNSSQHSIQLMAIEKDNREYQERERKLRDQITEITFELQAKQEFVSTYEHREQQLRRDSEDMERKHQLVIQKLMGELKESQKMNTEHIQKLEREVAQERRQRKDFEQDATNTIKTLEAKEKQLAEQLRQCTADEGTLFRVQTDFAELQVKYTSEKKDWQTLTEMNQKLWEEERHRLTQQAASERTLREEFVLRLENTAEDIARVGKFESLLRQERDYRAQLELQSEERNRQHQEAIRQSQVYYESALQEALENEKALRGELNSLREELRTQRRTQSDSDHSTRAQHQKRIAELESKLAVEFELRQQEKDAELEALRSWEKKLEEIKQESGTALQELAQKKDMEALQKVEKQKQEYTRQANDLLLQHTQLTGTLKRLLNLSQTDRGQDKLWYESVVYEMKRTYSMTLEEQRDVLSHEQQQKMKQRLDELDRLQLTLEHRRQEFTEQVMHYQIREERLKRQLASLSGTTLVDEPGSPSPLPLMTLTHSIATQMSPDTASAGTQTIPSEHTETQTLVLPITRTISAGPTGPTTADASVATPMVQWRDMGVDSHIPHKDVGVGIAITARDASANYSPAVSDMEMQTEQRIKQVTTTTHRKFERRRNSAPTSPTSAFIKEYNHTERIHTQLEKEQSAHQEEVRSFATTQRKLYDDFFNYVIGAEREYQEIMQHTVPHRMGHSSHLLPSPNFSPPNSPVVITTTTVSPSPFGEEITSARIFLPPPMSPSVHFAPDVVRREASPPRERPQSSLSIGKQSPTCGVTKAYSPSAYGAIHEEVKSDIGDTDELSPTLIKRLTKVHEEEMTGKSASPLRQPPEPPKGTTNAYTNPNGVWPVPNLRSATTRVNVVAEVRPLYNDQGSYSSVIPSQSNLRPLPQQGNSKPLFINPPPPPPPIPTFEQIHSAHTSLPSPPPRPPNTSPRKLYPLYTANVDLTPHIPSLELSSLHAFSSSFLRQNSPTRVAPYPYRTSIYAP